MYLNFISITENVPIKINTSSLIEPEVIVTYFITFLIFVFAVSNQALIMNKGGARLLANIASKTDDPQTMRMVAGAIANLCGNGTDSYSYDIQHVLNNIQLI